ncbi:MAG: U32 family peptidase [Bacillota bacterium]|nr:U32 family peptidase [Bacillota bacterium]
MKLPELLAPAGDMERLSFAYKYGADAAYIGCGDYSLRAGTGFGLAEIEAAVRLAHGQNKKLYAALNVFAGNDDIAALPDYIRRLAQLGPDALIVSDPGVFDLAREYAPAIGLHISTQANNTNWRSARFWARQGASRVVLARELPYAQAAAIAALGGLQTEIFVHGAVCISYSGRCLLSSFMTARDANHGACSHPCRWQYALCEQRRPGEYFAIEQDERGSYILNSRDLCLIGRIPELCAGGFDSLKIEGRNKSAYYVANCLRIYRAALDAYAADPDAFSCAEKWRNELAKVSHRGYCEGFFAGAPAEDAYRYDDGGYEREYDFCALALAYDGERLHLEQRNHLSAGDMLEILLPSDEHLCLELHDLREEDGAPIAAAPHPRQHISVAAAELPELPLPLICRRRVK